MGVPNRADDRRHPGLHARHQAKARETRDVRQRRNRERKPGERTGKFLWVRIVVELCRAGLQRRRADHHLGLLVVVDVHLDLGRDVGRGCVGGGTTAGCRWKVSFGGPPPAKLATAPATAPSDPPMPLGLAVDASRKKNLPWATPISKPISWARPRRKSQSVWLICETWRWVVLVSLMSVSFGENPASLAILEAMSRVLHVDEGRVSGWTAAGGATSRSRG